jgi:adenylate cyclase
MHADIAGYTGITGAEEQWTVNAIAEARKRFADRIGAHGGRIVSTPGDAVLGEFASVSEAVIASMEVQQAFAREPLVSPGGRPVQFRIGLHLADIYPDGHDILGDGVNLAARIESSADPGGVCFSGAVYEQIRDKLDILCSDLGEHSFKNVARPIRIYRLDIPPDHDDDGEPVQKVRAGSALVVPYRPTVAVLPFANLSGQPDGTYLADGITDSIINSLSRSRWFLVIARTSSFQFRANEDVRSIGRQLGARYILQGSVLREGQKVRVITHLNDATLGHLVQSHRHEGALSDIFNLQESIAMQVASTLEPEVLHAQSAFNARYATTSYTAVDHVLRAYAIIWEMTPATTRDAMQHLHAALSIDPSVPQAHIGLAMCATFDVYMGWTDDPERRLVEAQSYATEAVRLDRNDAWAHMALGIVGMQTNSVEDAVRHLKHAIHLNPSLALAYGFLATAMVFAGHAHEAHDLLRLATRLSPRDAFLVYWLDSMSMVHLMEGRLSEAEHWAERAVRESPGWPGGHRMLAIIRGLEGRTQPANEALQAMLRLQPNISEAYLARILPFRDPAHFETCLEGLRRAGWRSSGVTPT